MDVFNLFAKISLNTEDYERSLGEVKGETKSFWSTFAGTFLGTALSNGLSKAASGIMNISSAVATGAEKLAAASVASYSDYEQLVGGVETLFNSTQLTLKEYEEQAGKTGKAALLEWLELTAGSTTVMNNAREAFKTAGLSANDYMEQATSFAAALVNSLGGDTKAAADLADVAITDMADNVNKMGSSMESVQNAYNGFSKQNYTMLDNLKLGYGGTKSEMERLLADANKLNAAQGKYTKYSVDSYADIVNAIHDVQVNMGIYGTTAKEAQDTIQGSLAMTKSAWANLKTAMAGGMAEDETLDEYISDLGESIKTFAGNIIPRIKETVPRIISGMTDVITELAPYVSDTIKDLEPAIEQGIKALFKGLGKIASSLSPIVQDTFAFLGGAILDSIRKSLKNSDFSFVLTVFDGMKAALDKVIGLFANMGPAAGSMASSIISSAGRIWDKLKALGEWLMPYAQAVIDFIVQTVSGIVKKVTPILENMSSAFGHAWEIIKIIWKAAEPFFDGILQYLSTEFEIVAAFIGDVFGLAWTAITSVWNVAASYFSALWATIDAIFAVVEGVLTGDFSAAWEGIQNALSGWNDFFISLLKMIVDVFKDIGSFFWDVGTSMIKGISDGWVAAWDGFVDMVMGMVNAIIDRIKSAFSHVGVSLGGAGRSHAGGLDYVPYNGYAATLHRGEMVLTADEADKYRRGSKYGGSDFSLTQNIYAAKQTPAELAASTAAAFQRARWAL